MPNDRILLCLGVIGLLFPVPIFFSRKRRHRSLHQLDIERRNGSRWTMLTLILRFYGHWLELGRGLLASWCMLAGIHELTALSPLYAAHAEWARSVIPFVVGIVSVTTVEFLFRYPGKSLAPVSFVGGTLLMLLPPAVAIPSLVFGAFCGFALRSLGAFFFTAAPLLVVLGLLLQKHPWPALAGAVFAVIPPILSGNRNHELVIPVRRPRNE